MRLRTIFAAATLAVVSVNSYAVQHRSTAAKHAFQREHPCPSTGERRGRCPGYIVDHVVPLCAGGPDVPGNMQWQTIRDAKAKDKIERRECRSRR